MNSSVGASVGVGVRVGEGTRVGAGVSVGVGRKVEDGVGEEGVSVGVGDCAGRTEGCTTVQPERKIHRIKKRGRIVSFFTKLAGMIPRMEKDHNLMGHQR